MSIRAPRTASDPAYRAGALALFGALATILIAHGFERFGGFAPCPLCLMQRYAYYAAIPVLFLALVLLAMGRYRAAALTFFAVSLAFLANAGLGTYHAGAEWKFWLGPDSCTAVLTPVAPKVGDLLKQLETTRVARCDEAPWHMLGLSFAGWNVVISFLLFVAALQGAFAAVRR